MASDPVSCFHLTVYGVWRNGQRVSEGTLSISYQSRVQRLSLGVAEHKENVTGNNECVFPRTVSLWASGQHGVDSVTLSLSEYECSVPIPRRLFWRESMVRSVVLHRRSLDVVAVTEPSMEQHPPTLSLSMTPSLPSPTMLSQSGPMLNYWNDSVSAPMLDVALCRKEGDAASIAMQHRIECVVDSMLEMAAESESLWALNRKSTSQQTVESLLQKQEHRHFALKLLFDRMKGAVDDARCRLAVDVASYKVMVQIVGSVLRCGMIRNECS